MGRLYGHARCTCLISRSDNEYFVNHERILMLSRPTTFSDLLRRSRRANGTPPIELLRPAFSYAALCRRHRSLIAEAQPTLLSRAASSRSPGPIEGQTPPAWHEHNTVENSADAFRAASNY